jgi:hypothetical protein
VRRGIAGAKGYDPTALSFLVDILAAPVRDYLAALRASLHGSVPAAVGAIVGSAAVSWWVYVPVHELLHAFGCILAGGEVTRLEMDAIYGARQLQKVFPFIAVGSDYAGQLVDFDTGGSDLVYLATDALPYVLTVFPGVPLLCAAARETGSALRAAVKLGLALPVAFAPFISLAGDYYEMGSILVSRAAQQWQPAFSVERWRSDDLFLLVGRLFGDAGDGGAADAVGLGAALLLGTVLALLTYALGAQLARLLLGVGESRQAAR